MEPQNKGDSLLKVPKKGVHEETGMRFCTHETRTFRNQPRDREWMVWDHGRAIFDRVFGVGGLFLDALVAPTNVNTVPKQTSATTLHIAEQARTRRPPHHPPCRNATSGRAHVHRRQTSRPLSHASKHANQERHTPTGSRARTRPRAGTYTLSFHRACSPCLVRAKNLKFFSTVPPHRTRNARQAEGGLRPHAVSGGNHGRQHGRHANCKGPR
jgi:hypothetical protein